MANLRNNNPEKLWDYQEFNDCFGNTKIRVSDIDGIVERRGKFLVIETKRPNEGLPKGQQLLLEGFVKNGHTVLILYGQDTRQIEQFELWHLGQKSKRIERRKICGDLDAVKARVKDWFAWVEANN